MKDPIKIDAESCSVGIGYSAARTTRPNGSSGILRIQSVTDDALEAYVPSLADLFRICVDAGASLGFVPPISHEESQAYWRLLRVELQRQTRLLLVASLDDRLVGSGQLNFPPWPNAQHRAELQKLFVDAGVRRLGVGRALMMALHDAARERDRSLLLLNTERGGEGEHFYAALGYQAIGVIPGYTTGAGGELRDTLALYRHFPGNDRTRP